MNYEKEINDLKRQVKQLNESVLAMGKNNVGQVSKLDDTSNKVEQITPYKASKTAYIGDTEIVFNNVPSGNLSIYGLLSRLFRVERDSDKVTITLFEPLEDVTEVTISIQ